VGFLFDVEDRVVDYGSMVLREVEVFGCEVVDDWVEL
jgi:hypothetical protein